MGGGGGVGRGGHREVACSDCVALFDLLIIQLFKVFIHPPERNGGTVLSWCSTQYLRESLIVGGLLGITLTTLILPAFVLSLRAAVLHRDRS